MIISNKKTFGGRNTSLPSVVPKAMVNVASPLFLEIDNPIGVTF